MSERLELQLGHLHLTGELRGAHIHVTVRGVGAEGSRPLLGTLTMAGAEWTSLELLVQLQVDADARHLKDMVEVARIDALAARERAEHLQTSALLDSYQPLRSVIADWDWRGIVADGWDRDCYERAMEAAAKAMATVEAAFEKAKADGQA